MVSPVLSFQFRKDGHFQNEQILSDTALMVWIITKNHTFWYYGFLKKPAPHTRELHLPSLSRTRAVGTVRKTKPGGKGFNANDQEVAQQGG